MSHTTMIRRNVSCRGPQRKAGGGGVKWHMSIQAWEDGECLAPRHGVRELFVILYHNNSGGYLQQLWKSIWFSWEFFFLFFRDNFVVLKSQVNPVPAVSVVAWSEATQRNLSWKQSSWSAEVTTVGRGSKAAFHPSLFGLDSGSLCRLMLINVSGVINSAKIY